MTRLIAALKREFGNARFDATDVWAHACSNSDLLAAIDAEVPRARYKSKRCDGRLGDLNTRAIRMALRRLHRKGLRASYAGNRQYWSFRVED